MKTKQRYCLLDYMDAIKCSFSFTDEFIQKNNCEHFVCTRVAVSDYGFKSLLISGQTGL